MAKKIIKKGSRAATKKLVKKEIAKAKVDKTVPRDVESGEAFENRTYLTPDHKQQATILLYERDVAHKDMQISEQDVKNQRLEIRIMQEVNLVNAEQHLLRKSAAYKSQDDKVKVFLDTLRDLYKISGDLKFSPASGKIVR